MTVITRPGIVLRDMMDRRRLRSKYLALSLGIPESILSGVLTGKLRVSLNTALRLEAGGLETAEYWLTLQVCYELAVIRMNEVPLPKVQL